jgi:inhibitor of cysteine peptidase
MRSRLTSLGLLAAIGLACLSMACGVTDPSEFSDPASTVQVKSGEEFVLVLGSNPTTGFTWRLAVPVDEKVVHFVRSEYKPDPSDGRVGVGGKDHWTFKAIAAGSTVISFQYQRSSEPAPVSTTAFTVEVR